jgi:glutamate dehydrogenase
VHVNTDAIDNSAGVDTSDHEVNIKILLDAVVADGELDYAGRNQLLVQMTDEVGALVLRDNYEQNVLLGNAREQAASMLTVHARLMRALEKRGHLDRSLEFLPDSKALVRRRDEGLGLTSPEFAVLVAYAKLTLSEDLLASTLPDDPWFHETLRDYFPDEIVRRYDDRLATHRLRREIITTSLVNNMVNRGGITFAFRVQEETAASAEQIARAYVVAREVFDLRAYVARVEALDNVVPTGVQSVLYLEFRRLLDRAVRWLIQSRPAVVDIGAEIERYRATVAELRPAVDRLLVGAEQRRLAHRVAELTDQGVPADLAAETAALLDAFSLLDVTEIATSTGTPAAAVAPLYFVLSERFRSTRCSP